MEEAIQRAKDQHRLRPRAIIPVDLFGLPAEYGALERLSDHYDLVVIADGAQSFGAEYHGRRAGSLGHAGTTSFFPAKPFGCYGDGGAIFTNDDDIAARVASIRLHGKQRGRFVEAGLNSRLDTIQAAVLLAKLPGYPAELDARRHVAARYSANLAGVVDTPAMPEGRVSSWAQYSILTDHRETVRQHLRDHEIPTAIYYSEPLHLQPCFMGYGYKAGDYPVAERTSGRIISLPMHPYLENDEIDAISEIVIGACEATGGAAGRGSGAAIR